MGPSRTPQDAVLRSTRVLAATIVPFLVLAFAVLVPFPDDTRRLFAWQIKPTLSAMLLGSVYLGGAYFFVRAAVASQWHTIAGGFPSVGTFASLMGITTILHWDRFIHGNLAFWLWVALYFTTPFIVFIVFFRNQREYAPAEAGDLMISRTAARVIVAGAVLALLTSAFLYLFPHRAIAVWPWKLTPLTARMLGAIFALGLAGVFAARERRWSAARIPLQVEAFMLVLILVSGVRAHAQFDTTNPLTWLFAAGFLATALATAGLYLRMETHARSRKVRLQGPGLTGDIDSG